MIELEGPDTEGHLKEFMGEQQTLSKFLWQALPLSGRIVHMFMLLMIPVVLCAFAILFIFALVFSPFFVQSYEGRRFLLAFACFLMVAWWAMKRYVARARSNLAELVKELDALEDEDS